ncbi:MAG: hypothetical protein GC162_13770 [Planctomycetes bacterium]|nr:hypothetical protein [Planctomycetota bacterium]
MKIPARIKVCIWFEVIMALWYLAEAPQVYHDLHKATGENYAAFGEFLVVLFMSPICIAGGLYLCVSTFAFDHASESKGILAIPIFGGFVILLHAIAMHTVLTR